MRHSFCFDKTMFASSMHLFTASALALGCIFGTLHSERVSAASQTPELMQWAYKMHSGLGRLPIPDDELQLWAVMGDRLLDALKAYQSGDPYWGKTSGLPIEDFTDDSIRVEIVADKNLLSTSLGKHVQAFGATVQHDVDPKWVMAMVPISKLHALARSPGVIEIKLPDRVMESAEVSPAWRSSGARWWQLAGGMSGRNTRISIIDNFNVSTFAFLGSEGEIPPGISPIRRESFVSDHGNTMLRLAYDIAPNAAYTLVPPMMGLASLDFAEAIDFARARAPQIMSISLEARIDRNPVSPTASGPFRAAQERAAQSGILVTTSSGNAGYPGQHWSGVFVPGPVPHDKFIDWNRSTATQRVGDPTLDPRVAPRIDRAFSSVIVNSIGCYADGEELNFDFGLPVHEPSRYSVLLMRHLPGLGWGQVLALASPSSDSARKLTRHRVTNADLALRSPDFLNETTTTCGSGRAKYGIAIFAMARPTPSVPTSADYINGYTHNNFTIYNDKASVAESNSSPMSLTVGAANCFAFMGSEDQGCMASSNNFQPTATNSIGPALNAYAQPLEMPAFWLARNGDAEDNPYVVKPDLLTPSPQGLASSGATAITAGLAALLLERYPMVFASNPRKLKSALTRIAGNHAGGLPSIYARLSEDPANERYRQIAPNYSYGFGMLRLEREYRSVIRGRPNHARVNQAITSSPAINPGPPVQTTNPNGSEIYQTAMQPAYRWNGGLGNGLVTSFQNEGGGRVFYPVLKSRIEYGSSATSGTQASTVVGGNLPVATSEDAGLDPYWEWSLPMLGHYQHPSLRVTSLTTTSPLIGYMYGLKVRAQTMAGTALPISNVGTPMNCSDCFMAEVNTATFNVCAVGYRPPGNICPID